MEINDRDSCFFLYFDFFSLKAEIVSSNSTTHFSSQESCSSDLSLFVQTVFVFHKAALRFLNWKIQKKKQYRISQAEFSKTNVSTAGNLYEAIEKTYQKKIMYQVYHQFFNWREWDKKQLVLYSSEIIYIFVFIFIPVLKHNSTSVLPLVYEDFLHFF